MLRKDSRENWGGLVWESSSPKMPSLTMRISRTASRLLDHHLFLEDSWTLLDKTLELAQVARVWWLKGCASSVQGIRCSARHRS